MKKVMGGYASASNCDNFTGLDKSICQYNNCMSGWDNSTRTEGENGDKMDECYAMTSAC